MFSEFPSSRDLTLCLSTIFVTVRDRPYISPTRSTASAGLHRVQTWEDPQQTHPETKAKGDNDPLDVCEIGEQVGYVGQVKQVKVLGIMALLDEGETDWKVIVIDVRDPLASRMNDIEDVERQLPGLIRATNEWFRIYKIPDGKPENNFAFSGEAKNKKYATEIIHECHEAWRRLISGESPAKTASYDLSMSVISPADHMFWTHELTAAIFVQSQHHHPQLSWLHSQGRSRVPEPPCRCPQAPRSHRPVQ